jgi:hypothetical protein
MPPGGRLLRRAAAVVAVAVAGAGLSGLDAVRAELAGAVRHVLEPAHVSLWISQRD